MKHLKPYKIFENNDFEPVVDLEYIDWFIEDITDKGYDVQQYFGFKNREAGKLVFQSAHPTTPDRKHDKLHIVDRRYINALINPENDILRRPNTGNDILYQDYLNGDISYIIKIYSYKEEKGYSRDFPFGEITYSDIYGPLKQLTGYMSEERGLSHYKIQVTSDIRRSNEVGPWKFTDSEFNKIEDLKDIKIIGGLSLYISKDKELLPDKKI